MTLVLCQCGHRQVLHFGPTGRCLVRIVESYIDEKHKCSTASMGRCPCERFVLETRERADLV